MRYIDLMEKVLSAYSDSDIEKYFKKVKEEGLTEHGFPRLTANLGIIISYGRRRELFPLFLEMMDFCTEKIPRVEAANNFSVREIIPAIDRVKEIVSPERLSYWRKNLTLIDPKTCYSMCAKERGEVVHNWALFAAVSEYARMKAGLGGDISFVELQLETQIKRLDENGMYRDNLYSDIHQPMNYDLVPRMLFSNLLYLGYRGKFYEDIDASLKKAGKLTLLMQSVSGECAFGGRSNGFLLGEAILSVIFEYEAQRYKKDGDFTLALEFQKASDKAIDALSRYLSEKPISHVKNRFPIESGYGCETYAYFDKYMVTAASFLYLLHLIEKERLEGDVEQKDAFFETTYHFHKLFMRKGKVSLEFDLDGDPHYDASGLGRIHFEGAPSSIALSSPCPSEYSFSVGGNEGISLSFVSGKVVDGEPLFSTGESLRVIKKSEDESVISDGDIETTYRITENGVDIEAVGQGNVAFLLPVFEFDGSEHTKIIHNENIIEIEYRGFVCRYTSDAPISDLQKRGYNRNGYYKGYYTANKNNVKVKIEILKGESV